MSHPELNRIIGRNLYTIRNEMGLTQDEASKLFRCKYQSVYASYERSERRTPLAIMHIVHGLGYSLNWFIMGKGPRRRTDELPVLGGAVEAIVVVGELGKQKLTDAENAALQAALAQLRRHCD